MTEYNINHKHVLSDYLRYLQLISVKNLVKSVKIDRVLY